MSESHGEVIRLTAQSPLPRPARTPRRPRCSNPGRQMSPVGSAISARVPSSVAAGGCAVAAGRAADPRRAPEAGGHTRCTRSRGPPRVNVSSPRAIRPESKRSALFTWSEPMVTFLKGRRRNDDTVVAVDENGANVTAKLEALVARAEAAAEQLRQLAPVMERSAELDTLRERCVAVEQQVEGLAGPRRAAGGGGASGRAAERGRRADRPGPGPHGRSGQQGRERAAASRRRRAGAEPGRPGGGASGARPRRCGPRSPRWRKASAGSGPSTTTR